mmetsp:Transcript_24388/g.36179  ORF Transcript_24388/g.36179 Transcript_24388/m.36179 type:complete len:409 (-) Transcript_24388:107-1333(-)|eukprot:CAMPEP_0194216242 /NCGR_PEP_ID=MMETSP0156-20130528/18609_1 /TAXON_ID=33649 /ORGANISM="Thalassionema nitzschioides, Strain L26-B" /LENGTH=408 /DNA_ID=CAMNT_0038944963 /DNA_START=49 /DNA_END=1275 /DNA_ORIENTATION=+
MVPSDDEQKQSSSSNDFVIRNGFPALRDSKGKPLIEGKEPIPQSQFLSFSLALAEIKNNPELCNTLLDDCTTVFTARQMEDSAAYSTGCTYFVPAITKKPRCALEALALEIFRQHTRSLPEGSFVPEQSGAEWWTLVLDAAPPKLNDTEDVDDVEDHDEVGMHFDADYGLEDQAPGLLLHPRVATITYLSNYGAPTLILDQRSPPPNEKLNGDIRKGWLSGPMLGKHVAFDGRLLHGAPATFFRGISPQEFQLMSNDDERKPAPTKRQKTKEKEAESSKKEKTENEATDPRRVTFLVNIWLNHCPLDAELLEDVVAKQLKTPTNKELWKISLETPDNLETRLVGVDVEDPAGEEETVICNHTVTLFYNEKMEKQHEISIEVTKERKSYELDFSVGALRLETGDLVNDE